MISDMETRRKKIVTIAYCILCLVVSISLLTRDVINCYNKYLSGEYQLMAEAKIVDNVDLHFIDDFHGKELVSPIKGGLELGTEVYMYNIHDEKCDLDYMNSTLSLHAYDVPIQDLSYNSYDYKLLTREKRYSLYEYMKRINKYTPNQINHGFISGALEKKIYQNIRVFSVLLFFDLIYVIYKLISKKKNYISRIMNGIMYVSSTFCLLISVFGIYFV